MQLKVLPNDSRCSCGKPLETKEEQKNPLTELWYHAITLVSLCRGMLLIWCCEISWNYLKCLYIIPEKWVHLGQKVWAFASIYPALVHREQIFKDFVGKWIIQKFTLSLSLSSKSSCSRSQIQVYRQKRSLFPCSFFMSYDLITVLFQNVALGYHRK